MKEDGNFKHVNFLGKLGGTLICRSMLGFGTTVVRKTIRKFAIGNSKFIKISGGGKAMK